MGNYRFKLSHMLPSSWIHKLKDMSISSSRSKRRNRGPKPKKKSPQPQLHGEYYGDHQKSTTHHDQHNSVQKKSYHFPRDLTLNSTDPKLSEARYFPIPNPPRRSTRVRRTIPGTSKKNKKKMNRPPRRLVSSSVSAGCSCRATLDSVWAKTVPPTSSLPETEFSATPSSSCSDTSSFSSSAGHPPQLPRSFDQMVSWSTSCSSNDIVIDVGKRSLGPEIDLPPITTRPLKFTDMVKNVRRSDSEETPHEPMTVKVVKEQQRTITANDHAHLGFKPSHGVRGFLVSSPAVRLRISSSSTPRVVSKQRTHHHAVQRKCNPSVVPSGRSRRRRGFRSVTDSFAIMKSSEDPKADFRDSMVEMIRENNIKASNDLEELLACYLSLNSDEYHDVIISVFKQIWFDLNDIRV